MSDRQYREMLLDAREGWTGMLKALAPLEGPDADRARAWAQQQIDKIDEKLKL